VSSADNQHILATHSMTPTGLFITFEGIDGAGKSTHIDALAQALRQAGRVVTLTREPGGTPLAERLRELVLNEPMDPMTEALLVFASRREHLRQVIEPALARGEVVLCDRFTDASYAYQGGGRGFSLELLGLLEQWVQGTQGLANATSVCGASGNFVRQPDLTLYFELAPAIAAQRLARARTPDKFEAQPVEFFSRVAAGYEQRAQQQPQRFARLDAAQPREQVWLQVLASVRQKGWLP
jgi:dTMP kinase